MDAGTGMCTGDKGLAWRGIGRTGRGRGAEEMEGRESGGGGMRKELG